MSYRSILVQAEDSVPGRKRAEAAVAIAARFKAELTGVFLKSERIPYYVIGDGLVVPTVNVDGFVQERAEEIAKGSAAARSMFAEIAQAAGVATRWLDVNADTDLTLAACARRHDLSVLPVEMSAPHGDHTVSAARIGMASGGPLLIIPSRGFPKTFGRRVLVAWNDSREAARALRDAMPFLAQAEEIHFIIADKDAEPELDTWLQRHLALHGCPPARLTVDRDDDVPTGEIIRQRIDLVGADMVVLGLYGRPRLQEFVLGGVSKNLLDHITMPLLVSH
jgi:nucleotide-binding universal stress UspA family protein